MLTFVLNLREVSFYFLVSQIKLAVSVFLVIGQRPNPMFLSHSSDSSFASTLAGAAAARWAIVVATAQGSSYKCRWVRHVGRWLALWEALLSTMVFCKMLKFS